MKVLVAYFSKFGNTRQIAEAIAEVLDAVGSARVMDIGRLSVSDLEDVELVVMGSPTHRMNLPEAIRPVFESLPRHILRGTPVAVFDTSYTMSSWLASFTAARKLGQKLHKLGGKRIVPAETFHVEGREGPLCEGEVERAKTWAASILKQL
jgi:flavodoxin